MRFNFTKLAGALTLALSGLTNAAPYEYANSTGSQAAPSGTASAQSTSTAPAQSTGNGTVPAPVEGTKFIYFMTNEPWHSGYASWHEFTASFGRCMQLMAPWAKNLTAFTNDYVGQPYRLNYLESRLLKAIAGQVE
ncbi:hypothetical protein EJ06DRAFT_524716 [Trichodelitschia bisporula]|uniref:Uncharacterized protein n=1 Tax=Trichodelitschia bisporula TaxID=703511 RepID=A0A6G1HKG0_9PEZI|nr:hypothetical protein EJ06DRAFT_524716 [Trichodelitschia bisporula]